MTNDDDLAPDDSATALQQAVHTVLRGANTEAERRELDPHEQRLVDDLRPWLKAWPAEAARDHHLPPHPASLMPDDTDPVEVALWAPLNPTDPVAQMLGLIPNDDSAVNPKRLIKARRTAGLTLQQLVDHLNALGWNVQMRDAFRWERTAMPLAPALLAALAQIVRVDVAALTMPVPLAADVFTNEDIQRALAAWATDIDWDLDALTSRVRTTLATAAQRNAGQPSVTAVLAILEQLRSLPGFLDPS